MDSVVLRRKTHQKREETEKTEEYLGHTESVKTARLAMTKCYSCILSYLVMFNWKILN